MAEILRHGATCAETYTRHSHALKEIPRFKAGVSYVVFRGCFGALQQRGSSGR